MTDHTLFDVPDADLDDLRDRLRRTRWPKPWPTVGWEAGTDAAVLRRLSEYWADGYDWRAHERELAALPSHIAEVAGAPLHYLLFEAETPGALPIVLTNGWPSTFYELVSLARRLSTPSEFGGRPEDAFTVVVPSIPGFALTPQRESLVAPVHTHDLWHALMHDHLGFDRYAAHRGDLGAGITSRLAEAHPEALVGIHLMAVASPADPGPDAVTPEERTYLDDVARWSTEEGAYAHQQRTRPVSLAYGLNDSPVGLLAWILEKYRAWSDCHGDVSSRFSDDFLLTQASLYWFAESISTSFRPYYESGAGITPPVRRVDVPTAIALFPRDIARPPRSWAERTYDVRRYTEFDRGGHFAPIEEPDLLADDLRAFFGPLR
ncbi:hypothetical protein AS850_07340 [Frondihabitans sp. 762G35]|uniref:epoxide hydrolase family protein n=1 Tax=Frondihabitans sp. 762G35 TaxID=1446794 RepID=UPI000D2283BE|nr:epoxide hydrolase family protein [Frondihabitans sp. 762G35]ARC56890.1 hypothetical protein AS850_07340 [Frondihabitans sp. 762G35]